MRSPLLGSGHVLFASLQIHGVLSDNLYHSSNLCGRAYMISRPLMEYTLKFDSKEVVPYTYFLPKGSARQLTYHPSLITEGAFGSWNSGGFGRQAGAKQVADTEAKKAAASSAPAPTPVPAVSSTAAREEPPTEKKEDTDSKAKPNNFSALAFLQWSLKYTTAIEQTVANVHFWTNLPSPLLTEETFPECRSFRSVCREELRHERPVASWEEYRAAIGNYREIDPKAVCPGVLAGECARWFFYEKCMWRIGSLFAGMFSSQPQILPSARKDRDRTGLLCNANAKKSGAESAK